MKTYKQINDQAKDLIKKCKSTEPTLLLLIALQWTLNDELDNLLLERTVLHEKEEKTKNT